MPIIDDVFLSTLRARASCPGPPEEEEKAFSRISRLVASRERCACELEKRLVQDGFSERDAQSAIARAVSCGMVDDLRYADILVRSRVSQGRGRAGIEEELNRCGIDPRRLAGLARRILRHQTVFPRKTVLSTFSAANPLVRKTPMPPHVGSLPLAAIRRMWSSLQRGAMRNMKEFFEELGAFFDVSVYHRESLSVFASNVRCFSI